jgi:uncharacterized membrane protein
MSSLDEFAAAGPWPQRAVLRALVSLARRRRGRSLLRYLPQADQLAQALLATEHFDNPAVSRRLGWDPAVVTARGHDLRRLERRL